MSKLFIFINPRKDTATCYFFYFFKWGYKFDKTTFDLNKLPANKLKAFYKDLENEWNQKYRI